MRGTGRIGHAFTGDAAVFAFPAPQYAGVAVMVLAIGLLASTVPAALAMRARPLDAVRRG
ncbi:hypothetical protein [Marinactinospora rubrisoli]|uniref:ABC3 transporter permease protein domain-containing protein n=1 Tax=Marinactinospora rubrisoli TaxID=2715399 RepID=A0ABW2KFI6_9ACTN